jgi:transcriptional antiterminator RfaH
VAYWAATQLQPHRERVAQYFLEQAGFEVHLPRIRQRGVRYGRRVEVLTPLFPSYCFTRIELQCPGVIRLIKNGEEPAHVPDEIIAAIRRRERNGAIDLPKKRGPRTGDRVQIVSGLFAGRFGLCARVSRPHIGVLLYMLGAQRQVQLKHNAVEPA